MSPMPKLVSIRQGKGESNKTKGRQVIWCRDVSKGDVEEELTLTKRQRNKPQRGGGAYKTR